MCSRWTYPWLMGVIIFTPAMLQANCYVIRNTNSNGNIELRFQYNGPIPEGGVTQATVFPNQQFPLGGGQWCWNNTGSYSATVFSSGPGHLRGPNGQEWRSALVLGDGGTFSPSGTYTIGPP